MLGAGAVTVGWGARLSDQRFDALYRFRIVLDRMAKITCPGRGVGDADQGMVIHVYISDQSQMQPANVADWAQISVVVGHAILQWMIVPYGAGGLDVTVGAWVGTGDGSGVGGGGLS